MVFTKYLDLKNIFFRGGGGAWGSGGLEEVNFLTKNPKLI